jgi:hypothetical protein
VDPPIENTRNWLPRRHLFLFAQRAWAGNALFGTAYTVIGTGAGTGWEVDGCDGCEVFRFVVGVGVGVDVM